MARMATRAGMRRSLRSRWLTCSIDWMPRTRVETRARARVLQALYAWDVRGEERLDRVATQIWDDLSVSAGRAQARRRCSCARSSSTARSSTTSSPTSRRTGVSSGLASSIAACCVSAAAELQRGETPPRVVIQEAVRLAERYGTVQEREVREWRARRARAAHGTDVVRILLVNWQDARIRRRAAPRSICTRSSAGSRRRGTRCACSAAAGPSCPPRARLDGIDVYRVGTRHTFPFLARRAYYREHLDGLGRRARRGHQQGSALHAALGRETRPWRWCRTSSASTAFQELPAPLAAAVWAAERPLGRSVPRTSRFRRSARARPKTSRIAASRVGRSKSSIRASTPSPTRRMPPSARRRRSSPISAGSRSTRACISSFAPSPR